MSVVTAKVFRNGRNQAIRIPVEFSVDTDTVTIERQGNTLIIRPVPGPGWEQFFSDETMKLPEDFDVGEDLPVQEREPL